MMKDHTETNVYTLKNGLVNYRQIIMTPDSYRAIKDAESLLQRLIGNAHRAQGPLLDHLGR